MDIDVRLMAVSCNNIGKVKAACGERKIAIMWFKKDIAWFTRIIAKNQDDRVLLLKSKYAVGVYLKEEGEFEDAISFLEQALLAFPELESRLSAHFLFDIHFACGQAYAKKMEAYFLEFSSEAHENDVEDTVDPNPLEETIIQSEQEALRHFIAVVNEFLQMPLVDEYTIEKYCISSKFIGDYYSRHIQYQQAEDNFKRLIKKLELFECKSDNSYRNLIIMYCSLAECRIHLHDFNGAVTYLQKAKEFIRFIKDPTEEDKRAKKRHDLFLAACQQVVSGVVEVVEGYFRVPALYGVKPSILSSGVTIVSVPVYNNIVKSILKASDQNIWSSLTDVFNVFAINSMRYYDCFKEAYLELILRLRACLPTDQEQRKVVVCSLKRLLTVLSNAAKEKNAFLDPAIVTYLSNPNTIKEHAYLLMTLEASLVQNPATFFRASLNENNHHELLAIKFDV